VVSKVLFELRDEITLARFKKMKNVKK